MSLDRRTLLATSAGTLLMSRAARAQSKPVLKIGVMNDQSGPYRDDTGPTGVICVQQAVDELASTLPGVDIQVISADHQNKADIGVGIARQWFDQDGVDVIVDVPTSSVALAVSTVCRDKNKLMLNSGASTTDLTGAQCSPNTIQWTYDTYMLAKSTGGATVRAGGDTWYFITANYVFGQQLQRDAARFVTAAGGRVLGNVTYPFPETTDFSAQLLQAQASGAKVLGLANSGGDTINCIKQAHEFGLTNTMRIAAMLMYNSNVHALGLDMAQGLTMTETFYWNLNDRTRAFMERVKAKTPNQWPNMVQAGDYAAVLHYLKAVKDMGVSAAKADGRAVVERMKAMPTDDDCFGQGTIRADGRALHPAYLLAVKTPAESTGPWDLLKVASVTPADQAFRPMSEGGCALVKT
jgi:branched-chain amino acid transport system substrate-binding protein